MCDKTVVALRAVLVKTEMLLNPLSSVVKLISGLSKMPLQEGLLVRRRSRQVDKTQTAAAVQRVVRRNSLSAMACQLYLLVFKDSPVRYLVRASSTNINRVMPKSVLRLVKIPPGRPMS